VRVQKRVRDAANEQQGDDANRETPPRQSCPSPRIAARSVPVRAAARQRA
jgi:hypothetical protein